MAASPEALYKAHVENLRATDIAVKRIARELNSSLARGDAKTSDALLKTILLLLGAWSENRLKKLMYEPNALSEEERTSITNERTQFDSWNRALEIGFRRRHKIPSANLSNALPITARSHFKILSDVLLNDLKPIIEARNKLAHGQWSKQLNSTNSDFSPEIIRQIKAENAHSVKCKFRIIECLAQIIHDLVAGNLAFERDFDNHFSRLENAKRDIQARPYSAWLLSMQQKLSRGKFKRTQQEI